MISPIGTSISVRIIASVWRINVRRPLARSRVWHCEGEQLDEEVLAWFEAHRIAMRIAFEAKA